MSFIFYSIRSLCSLVCKWNYSANPNGKNEWNEEFFEQLNLRDLKKDNWRKIGTLYYIISKIFEKFLQIKMFYLILTNRKNKKKTNYKKIFCITVFRIKNN